MTDDERFNHTSLASVMQAINREGVKFPELPKLRQRAVDIYQRNRTALRNPASVAVVFWAALQRGKSAGELLETDEGEIIELAQKFELTAYGKATEPQNVNRRMRRILKRRRKKKR